MTMRERAKGKKAEIRERKRRTSYVKKELKGLLSWTMGHGDSKSGGYSMISSGNHRSHAGKQNRSLQTTVHTAGSKSFARYAHELEKEKQVPINRADLYKTVHMRSDGSPINPDVAEKIRRMEEIGLNDSGSSQTSDEFRVDGSIGWSPSDRYAQVIGPERHGRIRGVGLGPTPSSHPTNTNEQRQYQDVPNNNQFHQQFIDHLMQVGKQVLTMPMTQKVEEQMVLKVDRIKFRVICTSMS
ncbi:hypothetical protein CJ030_MR6G007071 [Morella rubra]|uniref:Uncharacterized protein n=1 Tax=Morella rubra TaxID=262757 RepID=A0A6A1V7Z1_9ROSI|nr:hypothetical protein CJ030_MR6G007071 [Morella rubra]